MSDQKDESIEEEEEAEDESQDDSTDDKSSEDENSNDDKSKEEDKSEDKSEEDKSKDKQTPKANDEKDRNRKGYEQRHQNKGVSREEHESLKSTVETIAEENRDLKFRNAHADISDEFFNSLKAFAKGSGKELDVALKDPVMQAAYETFKSKDRTANATSTSPSTKTRPGGGSPDYANMSSDEFTQEKNRVLIGSRD